MVMSDVEPSANTAPGRLEKPNALPPLGMPVAGRRVRSPPGPAARSSLMAEALRVL